MSVTSISFDANSAGKIWEIQAQDWLPRHVGSNVFPDFTAFHRLLYLGHLQQDKVLVHDVAAGVKATVGQYLSDILHLRNTIFMRLEPATQRKLLRGGEVYICLMAHGGYEFAVAIFAIVALGAVAVPICKSSRCSLQENKTPGY